MVLSGREVLKFALFVVLVTVAALYVVSHRESLFGPQGAPGPAEVVGAPVATPSGGRENEARQDGDDTLVVPAAALEAAAQLLGTGLPVQPGGDPFAEHRLEREQARAEQLELLRELLRQENLDEATRRRALDMWLSITDGITKEVDIENLIRAKGYADAVVVLGRDRATVIVRAESLTPEDVVRIADAVVRVTGLDYEDVAVMARGG
ncbi:MAG: SpoIIIAH-like family protein [Firmicutes bacterium]|nr:SpoIIIAH-like family protein [Bacillota bacterium]